MEKLAQILRDEGQEVDMWYLSHGGFHVRITGDCCIECSGHDLTAVVKEAVRKYAEWDEEYVTE